MIDIVDYMEEIAVWVDEKDVDGIDIRSSRLTFLAFGWVDTDLRILFGVESRDLVNQMKALFRLPLQSPQCCSVRQQATT